MSCILSAILKKSGFSRHIFIIFPSIKFQGNLSSGRKADIYGQTDGQPDGRGEAKSRFLRQCESAEKNDRSDLEWRVRVGAAPPITK